MGPVTAMICCLGPAGCAIGGDYGKCVCLCRCVCDVSCVRCMMCLDVSYLCVGVSSVCIRV